MTYALLQQSLDQTISRAEMEEASVAVPSVARADCAVLQRELFGVVVSGLERADALAFQAALRVRGFPTDVVADDELPVLAEPVRGLAVRVEPEAVVNTDMYGHEQRYARDETVFLAGGFVKDWVNRSEEKLKPKLVGRGKSASVELVTERQRTLVAAEEFRLELFIGHEPWRIQWALAEKSILRANGRAYQLRDRWELGELLRGLRDFVPEERMNRGIRDAGIAEPMVYPSGRAFEEEIVWRFYQLTKESSEL